MTPTFKDSTRKSIREYVLSEMEKAKAAKNMSPEVLAAHSGVDLDSVVAILFNKAPPEFDEACMMFTALGLPLDYLIEHVKAMPWFMRQDVVKLELVE